MSIFLPSMLALLLPYRFGDRALDGLCVRQTRLWGDWGETERSRDRSVDDHASGARYSALFILYAATFSDSLRAFRWSAISPASIVHPHSPFRHSK